jgi:uncharacterized protein YceH (UPF0502 family)
MTLDPIQLRVLGALIEKEITTPENYPLSLNSLIAACNQRSSRDPVLDLTEDEVRQAVHSLEDMEIVAPVRDARVPKYEHRIRTVLNLRRDETAILCLLLLRGPQTPGELRGRADRMFSFDDIAAVQSTLERMASRTTESDPTGTGPLVVQLARQPGSRESRHAHLLGGPVAAAPQEPLRSRATAAEAPALTDLKSELRSDLISEVESALQAKFEDRLLELLTRIASLEARIDRLEAVPDKAAVPLQPTPPL